MADVAALAVGGTRLAGPCRDHGEPFDGVGQEGHSGPGQNEYGTGMPGDHCRASYWGSAMSAPYLLHLAG